MIKSFFVSHNKMSLQMKWQFILVICITSILDVAAKCDIDKWQTTNCTIENIDNHITLYAKAGQSYSWSSVTPRTLG